MSVDTEPRAPRANTQSSPTFRQTGFSVPTASAPATNDVNALAVAHHLLSPKMPSSNSSLNAALTARPVGFSNASTLHDDGDSDMAEASQLPLPIPGSLNKLEPASMASQASRSPNDVPTPPDAPSVAPHKASLSSSHSASVRLPPLSASMLSPRYSTLQGSSISSGPTSITSSNWSPSRSTDPHLYSISAARKYSYTSFSKPSLSTSFKTSAMRMRGPALDDDEDEEDDSFGKPLPRYARGSIPTDRATAESSIELEGDEVFSFSSPCFGPKQLPDDSVPSPELHEAMPPSQAAVTPGAIMSPSWATASLGKLSLGGSEARGSPSSASARRTSRSQHHHHTIGALSSSADVAAAAMKQRRYSHNKHARPSLATPGPSSYTYSSSFGRDHPYARTPTSTSFTSSHHRESRSRSRSRYGIDERDSRSTALADDDETDEEMRMDDDDATEDEADYAYGAYSTSYHARMRPSLAQKGDPALGSTPSSLGANPSNASLGLTFQMSPANSSTLAKGHPLDASRSPVMANANVAASLSRQYSSDRHAVGGGLAPLRHHPYATSPSATTGPLSASMGLAYSPGSNAPLNHPAHRRGGSLGNGLAAPAYSAGILSTSPRFGNTAVSARSPDDGSSDRLSQSPYGASSGSPYAAGARGLNATGSYYGPTQGGAYSQSPRYSQSYGARKDSSGYASTLAAHFEKHERSDSMASETTEVGDASSASAASARKASAKAGVRSTSNTGASGNTDETAQVAAIRDRLGGAASCSAFISKLWHLMINPAQYSKYIRWDEAGTSIILSSEPEVANEFASDILPRLFKHGNNASFIRQLNLYGFQRIPSSRLLDAAEMKVAAAKRAELGGGTSSSTLNTAVQLYGVHSSFAHPRFLRGREELLPTMKPRSSKKPKKAANGSVNGATPRSLEADTSLGADETDEEDFAL